MSKILEASCVGGVVTIEEMPVEATILSDGIGESTGVALIEEDKVTYLTSNASDIEDLIDAIGEVVDKIITVATGLDGATNAPGAQTANIVLITTAKTELIALKEMLK